MQSSQHIFHRVMGAAFSLSGLAVLVIYVLALSSTYSHFKLFDRLTQLTGAGQHQESAALVGGDAESTGGWWRNWLDKAGEVFAQVHVYDGNNVWMAAPVESSELLSQFDALNFLLPEPHGQPVSEVEVPRLYVHSLPKNLTAEDNGWARKRDFIRTLLPLVLAENEKIQNDRARAQRLQQHMDQGHKLYSANRTWLINLAARYGMDGFDPRTGDWKELLRRVDGVPPSLALAQAAVESGWGTSRFALHGNALFGQWSWKPGSGIIPADRAAGGRHEIRRFDRLSESVSAYLHNLNTHDYYAKFREHRAATRVNDKLAPGFELVKYLDRYSKAGQEYIKDVRAVIQTNMLQDLDAARLQPVIGAPLTSS